MFLFGITIAAITISIVLASPRRRAEKRRRDFPDEYVPTGNIHNNRAMNHDRNAYEVEPPPFGYAIGDLIQERIQRERRAGINPPAGPRPLPDAPYPLTVFPRWEIGWDRKRKIKEIGRRLSYMYLHRYNTANRAIYDRCRDEAIKILPATVEGQWVLPTNAPRRTEQIIDCIFELYKLWYNLAMNAGEFPRYNNADVTEKSVICCATAIVVHKCAMGMDSFIGSTKCRSIIEILNENKGGTRTILNNYVDTMINILSILFHHQMVILAPLITGYNMYRWIGEYRSAEHTRHYIWSHSYPLAMTELSHSIKSSGIKYDHFIFMQSMLRNFYVCWFTGKCKIGFHKIAEYQLDYIYTREDCMWDRYGSKDISPTQNH
jgi:hypothetical protein